MTNSREMVKYKQIPPPGIMIKVVQLMIQVTPAAADKIKDELQNNGLEADSAYIRLYVTAG